METEYVFNPLTGEFDLVRKGGGEESGGGGENVADNFEVCIGTTMSASKEEPVSDNMQCTIYGGSFDYEINEDGERLVISLPEEFSSAVISSNGFVIPMEDPFLSDGKKIYVSSVGLKKGLIENISITINY